MPSTPTHQRGRGSPVATADAHGDGPPATAGGAAATGFGQVFDEAADAIEHALHFPEGRNSRWRSTGLSKRGERYFDLAATAILLTFLTGWAWAITDVARVEGDLADGGAMPRAGLSMTGARISAALTDAGAPSVAFLTEAAIDALVPARGSSGKLQAIIRDPGAPLDVGELPESAAVAFAEHSGSSAPSAAASAAAVRDSTVPADSALVPDRPGVWGLVLAAGQALAPLSDFAVITRRPLSDRRQGRVGLYYIGTWPTERRAHEGYRTPSGFIEVTPRNMDTQLSDHFRLRDFLTHGQDRVWPKYLVVDMRLVDKLELVLDELAESGVKTGGVTVMSGFRTPQYNANGGVTDGRAALSRHMYGDAADIYIDSDGDGVMDDLDHDGRVSISDARVVAAAAERVERRFPALIGGVGVYPSGPGHGPFVHIDTRGYRARW